MESGAARRSLAPHIRPLKAFQDADGITTLNQLARSPKKAQRVFARALAEFHNAAIIDNANIEPTVKVRVTVCKGYGASDWLRALPCKETLLLDAQYGIAFALSSVFQSRRLVRAPHA
jgi:hypothetical protein